MSAPPPGLRARDERPTFVDITFAAALVVVGLPEAFLGAAPHVIAIALDLALAPALVWRRRAPTAAFATIVVVTYAQWLISPHDPFEGNRLTAYHLVADIALLVAFYTVASREPRRRTLAAALVLEVALLLATLHVTGGRNAPGLFVLLSGTAAAAGIGGNNVRTRRAYLAAVEQRAATLEIERDQQARLAAAAERARIAREMHDVVAHNISVMIALADGASFAADTNPRRASEAMGQVAATGRQALGEMRRLLGVLREGDAPTVLQPQPGLTRLGALVAQVRRTGLDAKLVTEGPLPTLPPGLQLAVYRMVQESLTNTLKHATDATSAVVTVRLRGQRLDVDVVDDGRAPAAASPPGHGITGMRERAALYGGTVTAGPAPPFGWRVTTSFDVSARELVP